MTYEQVKHILPEEATKQDFDRLVSMLAKMGFPEVTRTAGPNLIFERGNTTHYYDATNLTGFSIRHSDNPLISVPV